MPPRSNQPSRKSDYQIIKDGGFRDMKHFMESYGLRMHDDDDLQEAKAILQMMRENDAAAQSTSRSAK